MVARERERRRPPALADLPLRAAMNSPLRAAMAAIKPGQRTQSPVAHSPITAAPLSPTGGVCHGRTPGPRRQAGAWSVAETAALLREVRDQHDPRVSNVAESRHGHRHVQGHARLSSPVACPRCQKGRATANFSFLCGRSVSLCRQCATSFCFLLSEKIYQLSTPDTPQSPASGPGLLRIGIPTRRLRPQQSPNDSMLSRQTHLSVPTPARRE
jgi:hypothetical protein